MSVENILKLLYLDRLFVTDDVKAKRDNMAQYLHQVFPNIPYPSLQGLILLALIEWQQKTRKLFYCIHFLPYDEKIKAITEINDLVQQKVQDIVDVSKKNSQHLAEIFQGALLKAKKMYSLE